MSPHNAEEEKTERNSRYRNGMHHYKSFASFPRIKKL